MIHLPNVHSTGRRGFFPRKMKYVSISLAGVVIGVLKQFRHSSQPLNWTRGLQLSSPESGPSTPRIINIAVHVAPQRAHKGESTLDLAHAQNERG